MRAPSALSLITINSGVARSYRGMLTLTRPEASAMRGRPGDVPRLSSRFRRDGRWRTAAIQL